MKTGSTMKSEALQILDDLRGAYDRYERWKGIGGNDDLALDAWQEVQRLHNRWDTYVLAEGFEFADRLKRNGDAV